MQESCRVLCFLVTDTCGGILLGRREAVQCDGESTQLEQESYDSIVLYLLIDCCFAKRGNFPIHGVVVVVVVVVVVTVVSSVGMV